MRPKHRDDGPAGLRLDAAVTDPARADLALFAIAGDGAERRLAAWSENLADLGLPVDGSLPGAEIAGLIDPQLQRSPTGHRVAVRIDGRAWTFDLSSGEAVHDDPGEGDRAAAEHDAVDDGFRGSPLLIWDGEAVARVRFPSSTTALRATIGPNTELVIRGPVDDRPLDAPSYSGSAHVAFDLDTPDELAERTIATLRRRVAEVLDREQHPAITLFRDGRPTVIQADTTTWRRGAERAVWPPLTGPRGLLLRRAIVDVPKTVEPDADDRAASLSTSYLSTSTEMLSPWLVAPDGTARELPFVLGNHPLATLPDGRFLLPCAQPMWWDGGNEPLTALADDGTTEPLLLGGQPMTPTAIVRAVAPTLVAADEPTEFVGDDFDGWLVTTARLRGDELTLALQPTGPTPGRPWLLVGAVLDGLRCDSPRLIATGTAPADGITRLIV